MRRAPLRARDYSTHEPRHLSDAALRLAATLWAQARNRGTPTADSRELDCDVLIAAQALSLGVPDGELVVATANVGHFAQFVAAELWTNIPTR